MKTRTLSRGLIRLRKCVALLVTCSLLLMIFAPASQAYLAPRPSDPVPMEYDSKDGDPWDDIRYVPSNKAKAECNSISYYGLMIKLLIELNIIDISVPSTSTKTINKTGMDYEKDRCTSSQRSTGSYKL